ncbi:MAG: hypothetical protein CMF69_04750 [Magnetovibrio sp.]|nr:hypothetical protein [Magnetovibrio sp.]|tara:strand:+ start:773 stop:1015 length:243 start_codon:yes stop_codon:yes gene_type:complete
MSGDEDYSRLDAVSYAYFNKGLYCLSKNELIKMSIQLLVNQEITEEARVRVYDHNIYLEKRIKDMIKKKKKKRYKNEKIK